MHPRRVAYKLLRKLLRAAIDAAEATKPRGARTSNEQRDADVATLLKLLWSGNTAGAAPRLPPALAQHADWLVLPCDYSTDDPKVRHTTNYFLTPDKAAMGASLLARLAMLYTHVTGEPPPYALCPRRGSMQKRFVDLSAQDLYLLLDEDDTAFVRDWRERDAADAFVSAGGRRVPL
ncbi:hypothetical protein KFE25_006662 [Diacronema lutheri]|uniref:Uncharacterized protein n=1 Tax=Diacronema lutheri TaxID=2081491 RepID=A0A8J5XTG2_DIALT|nr:hypothetical protein KFE25_006662 [Diacronema lutheri]